MTRAPSPRAAAWSALHEWVSNYAYISSAGVIMILPAIILFLLLQRRFVEGMTAGGLKL